MLKHLRLFSAGSMNANIREPVNFAPPLRAQVETALQDYFLRLDGYTPAHLYKMVLKEVEPPLLATVMRHTRGNQTRAAEMLGINRTTLRKKLKQYELD